MKWIAAVLVAGLALPAWAQKPAPGVWRPVAIEGGCTVMLNDTTPLDATWDQACVAGEPIAGRGTLRVRSAGRVVAAAGDFIHGVPHGAFTLTVFDHLGRQIATTAVQYDMGCAPDSNCTPYAPALN